MPTRGIHARFHLDTKPALCLQASCRPGANRCV